MANDYNIGAVAEAAPVIEAFEKTRRWLVTFELVLPDMIRIMNVVRKNPEAFGALLGDDTIKVAANFLEQHEEQVRRERLKGNGS